MDEQQGVSVTGGEDVLACLHSAIGLTVAIPALTTSAIGLFAIVAQFTPNTSDNKLARALLSAVNVAGMNNGRARNDPAAK